MTSTWLVPVDEQSFQKTLTQPIDLSDWDDRPSDFPARTRVWGVRTDPKQGEWSMNKSHLEDMKTGDPLLFYRNSKSRYDAAGTIGQFAHTTYVRDSYWNGGPAIDIYTIENYDDFINMTTKEVNQLLRYKEGYYPQGLSPVASDWPTDQLLEQLSIGSTVE